MIYFDTKCGSSDANKLVNHRNNLQLIIVRYGPGLHDDTKTRTRAAGTHNHKPRVFDPTIPNPNTPHRNAPTPCSLIRCTRFCLAAYRSHKTHIRLRFECSHIRYSHTFVRPPMASRINHNPTAEMSSYRFPRTYNHIYSRDERNTRTHTKNKSIIYLPSVTALS